MGERAFLIQKASSVIFTNHLDVSKCELPSGLNGKWKITGNGWVSSADDLGRIVGEDVKKGDTCVFKFDFSVKESDREQFRTGLLEILKNKHLTRI